MTNYTLLTREEKLALDNDQFLKAVKLEAISRGIKPPITLDEAIKRTEFVGYQIHPEHTKVYQITRQKRYSNVIETGVAYLDIELARRALVGAVSIDDEGYGGDKRKTIQGEEFAIQETHISIGKMKLCQTGIEEYFQDDKEFDAIAEECRTDLQNIRQGEYNDKVRAQKKREYLELSNGDESIAQAFWAKTEKDDWPA